MRFHTSLPVHDLDATETFYRTLFDLAPVKRKSDYLKFLTPGLNISFHTGSGRTPPTSLHLGFELESRSALDALARRLASAGLLSSPRETSVCCYAEQDKLRVSDPNGYDWELYYLVQDSEQRIDPASACCASARERLPQDSSS